MSAYAKGVATLNGKLVDFVNTRLNWDVERPSPAEE